MKRSVSNQMYIDECFQLIVDFAEICLETYSFICLPVFAFFVQRIAKNFVLPSSF